MQTTPTGVAASTSSKIASGLAFSAEVDGALRDLLDRMQGLYDEGKRIFVVVSHADPDADSVGASLKMAEILERELGSEIEIRFMHEGRLRSEFHSVQAYKAEPTHGLLSLLDSPETSNKVALVLVDHHELQRGLSSEVVSDLLLRGVTPDLILDHHGTLSLGRGKVIDTETASTVALALRLEQLANLRREARINPFGELKLPDASSLNYSPSTAAVMLAGVLIDAELPLTADWERVARDPRPSVRWAFELLNPHVVPGALTPFDLEKVYAVRQSHFAAGLPTHLGQVSIGGRTFQLLARYIGIIDEVPSFAMCAINNLRFDRYAFGSNGPVATLVFGVLRPSGDLSNQCIAAGEIIQFSIRSDPHIPTHELARCLSQDSGGKPGAAGGCWCVTEDVPHNGKDDRVFRLWLQGQFDLIRRKLPRPTVAPVPTSTEVSPEQEHG